MPKFQAGDRIVCTNTKSIGIRTVIGYQSNGYVVYEYEEYPGKAPTLHAAPEISFNLVPKVRKGYVCVRHGIGANYFVWEQIYPTQEAAQQAHETPRASKPVAIIEIEFEEKA